MLSVAVEPWVKLPLAVSVLFGLSVSMPLFVKAPAVVKLRPLNRLKVLVLPTVFRLANAAKFEFVPLRITVAPPKEVMLEPAAKLRLELAPTFQVPAVSEPAESWATEPV